MLVHSCLLLADTSTIDSHGMLCVPDYKLQKKSRQAGECVLLFFVKIVF